MIERILLAPDGPGAWSAAAAIADLIEASEKTVEVQVLHVNEVEYNSPPAGSDSTDPFPGPTRWWPTCGAGSARRGPADDVPTTPRPAGRLIAMSCRPRSLLRYAFTGSVSQAVSMRAGCPVTIVREPGFRV